MNIPFNSEVSIVKCLHLRIFATFCFFLWILSDGGDFERRLPPPLLTELSPILFYYFFYSFKRMELDLRVGAAFTRFQTLRLQKVPTAYLLFPFLSFKLFILYSSFLPHSREGGGCFFMLKIFFLKKEESMNNQRVISTRCSRPASTTSWSATAVASSPPWASSLRDSR